MLGDLPSHLEQHVEQLRKLELMRLDAMAAGLWPRAVDGDAVACVTCLKVMERRATLLGLDTERSADVTPIEQHRPLQHLSDEQLLKRFDILRSRISRESRTPSP
jgi:hypothetical protein